MTDVVTQDQEQQIKKLKRLLEGWRVALLPLKSIILWEQQWHPCAIIGSVSFLFLIIWVLDMSTLATISIVGLIFNFVDFIIPVITNSLYGPDSWTGQKEKIFEDICKSIVVEYNKIFYQFRSFYAMRDSSPSLYYIISISLLCTLAWVASSINNVFLLYILSVVMLLWPGVQHRGMLNAVLGLVKMGPKTIKRSWSVMEPAVASLLLKSSSEVTDTGVTSPLIDEPAPSQHMLYACLVY